jgi:5'-deoxynucleotidase YfbR-like HD superfamily hydrolase
MEPPPGSPLAALLALQPLEWLPRTGWVMNGLAAPETIAGHLLGACHAVLALGPRVDPKIDVERALALALVHDAPEARIGDWPRSAAKLLPEGTKARVEEAAAREVLGNLSPFAIDLFVEYRAQTSREARFARVCERLQLGVRLAGYRRLGIGGLEDFAETVRALDCSEFAPAEALQREILAEVGPRGRA